MKCPMCGGTGTIDGGSNRPAVTCSQCGGSGEVPFLSPQTAALGVPEMLEAMAATFRERNAQYGDNWKMVGKMMVVMFPNGVRLETPDDYDMWHIFELMIVKLSRLAISGLTHQDSIHDLAVYTTMLEAILKKKGGKWKLKT